MFYDILDKKRLDILPLFESFKNDFYLAGGTGLALQIGHRDSVDFDFFSSSDLDTEKLFNEFTDVFQEYDLLKIQEEKNTLGILIDNDINLSFFTYRYPLLNPLINEDNLHIASLDDTACMKLSAITGRASNKDYIDLYFILQKRPLDELLILSAKKFKDIDTNIILKSLIYFEDIEEEYIIFKNNNDTPFGAIKEFLRKKVKEIF